MALITKLDQSVTDTNLLPLGGIRLLCEAVADPNASKRVCGIAGQFTAIINGNGYFTDNTLTDNQGKTKTFTGASVHYFWTSNGDYEIFVTSKYDITQLVLNSEGVFADIDTLSYLTACTSILFSSTKTNGDVSKIKECPVLTSITRWNNTNRYDQIVGDADKLIEQVPSLITLNLNRTSCVATLKKLAESSLTSIDLYSVEGVSGDLSEFANVGRLTSFKIGALVSGVNTKITGSITDLGKNISATLLAVPYTSVTGTCDDLAAELASNGKTSGSVQIIDASNTTKTFNFPLV